MRLKCTNCDTVVYRVQTWEEVFELDYDDPDFYSNGEELGSDLIDESEWRCSCGDIEDIEAELSTGRLQVVHE